METIGVHKRWRFKELDEGNAQLRHIAVELGIDPLVASLLAKRGLTNLSNIQAFLQPKLTNLHDPDLLPGAHRAATRICRAVRQHQPIVIYGDYDVDGITASSILWHVLKQADADVSIYIPHRIEEGYGLNNDAIVRLTTNRPLIITVDCGITAIEPADIAQKAGVDLIITDHHDFDTANSKLKLPNAHTLVHPKLPGSSYPFPELCGAGVSFKLAWAFVKQYCGSDRVPDTYRSLLLNLLSYVALGTVADVVPLVDENRVLTIYGLGQIKRTPFVGLNALIDASQLRSENIDAYHVGFVLGPRLNACGRMGHADQAVRLLTEVSPEEASQIAKFLTRENNRRRHVEKTIFEEAKKMVTQAGYDADDSRAIVLGKKGWHPGVVGIVASRLVDTFARPVVVLNFDADSSQQATAHGSARSVTGVSICEAFDHCADMLDSYGGHAMAAGLRMSLDRVEEFRTRLIDYVNRRLSSDDLIGTLEIDAVCALQNINLTLFDQIYALAPFGRGNPSPILCIRGVTTERPAQQMGQHGRHIRLVLRQGQRLVWAVGFGMGHLASRLPAGVTVDIVFEPKISTWQGRRRPELHLRDICFH